MSVKTKSINEESSMTSLSTVTLGLLLPVVYLSIGESIFMMVYKGFLVSSSMAGYAIHDGPMMLSIILLSFAVFQTTISCHQGLLLAAAGGAIALLIESEFRGVYVWPGTFHLDDVSSREIVSVFICSYLIGGIAGKLKLSRQGVQRLPVAFCSVMLALSVIFSWANALGLNASYGNLPITRNWALTILGLIFASVCIASRLGEFELA